MADAETTRIIEANAAAEDLFNRPATDLIGRCQKELHPADKGEQYLAAFQRGIDSERVNRLSDGSPLYIETANGQRKPVEINAERIEAANSVSVLGVFREISEQLERERQLEATTARLNALLNALPVPVAVTDTDGIVTRWNPAAEATFGYPPADVIGDSYSLFIDDDEFTHLFERVTNGRGLDGYDTTLRAADGSQMPVELYVKPIYEDGTFSGAIGAAIDLSDRRQRERQLTVLNRVLRHNLRNDLNAINGWITQLDATDETQQEAIARINNATDRLVSVSEDATEIRHRLNNLDDDSHSRPTISVQQAHTKVVEEIADYDSLSVETANTPEWATISRHGIDAVIELLCELSVNLVEAELTIDTYDKYIQIKITAADSILSPEQRSFIMTGEETALNHLDNLRVAKTSLEIDSVGGTVTTFVDTSHTDALLIELPRTDN